MACATCSSRQGGGQYAWLKSSSAGRPIYFVCLPVGRDFKNQIGFGLDDPCAILIVNEESPGGPAMEDAKPWLKGEETCNVLLWNGVPLSVSAPNSVLLKITETVIGSVAVAPGVKLIAVGRSIFGTCTFGDSGCADR